MSILYPKATCVIATFLGAASLACAAPAQADESQLPQMTYLSYKQPIAPIPKDFMYKGKPVAPTCIDRFFRVEVKDTRLEDCSTPPPSTACGYSEDHSKAPWTDTLRGFTGYCYPDLYKGAAIAYKYIGKISEGHVIIGESCSTMDSSSCRDGFFVLKIVGPRLKLVKNLMSETHLGASDLMISNGKILYTAPVDAETLQKLSRVDFTEIADLKDQHTTQDMDKHWIYYDLFLNAKTLADEDVAEFEEEQLKQVQLVKYTGDFAQSLVEDKPARRRENCFLKVHNSYIEKNKTVLSPEELKQFMQKVIDTCKH